MLDAPTSKMKSMSRVHDLVSQWTKYDVSRRLQPSEDRGFLNAPESELLSMSYENFAVAVIDSNQKDSKEFFQNSCKRILSFGLSGFLDLLQN